MGIKKLLEALLSSPALLLLLFIHVLVPSSAVCVSTGDADATWWGHRKWAASHQRLGSELTRPHDKGKIPSRNPLSPTLPCFPAITAMDFC